MKERESSFRLAFGLLAGLILIRFLPLVIGTKWLWGVGHLSILPAGFQIGAGIVGTLALLLPFLSQCERWGETLAAWFNRIFFESTSKYWYRSLVLLLFGLIFVIFRMPTHFLGDGYTFLANVGSASGRWIKWSEGGALVVAMWVQGLIGVRDLSSALLAFQITSIASGLVTVWFFFLIVGEVASSPFKRLLFFITLLSSGSTLLFFGYVESYPILWGPVTGFLYFSLKYISQGKGLWGGLVCLLVATLLHLQTAMYFPAFLFLILCRGKGEQLYRKFKPLVWSGVALGGIVALVLFYREFNSNLFFQNIFLFPFEGKPIAPGYAIFSPRHLSDILNLLILIVPLGLVPLTLMIKDRQSVQRRRSLAYLGLLSVGSGLFLLVVDPSLSMPRDWDLFALCCLVPGMWLLYLIPESTPAALRRLLVPFFILAILSIAPFLLVNLNTQWSIAEIEQIIDNNPEKSAGTMSILSNYLGTHGELKAADSVATKMAVIHPEYSRWKNAYKLMWDGKPGDAYRLFSSVRPDRFSREYHAFLAQYYLDIGRPDSGLVHAQLAVQLQKYVDETYVWLANAYQQTGNPAKSLETLRQGFELNSQNRELVLALALVHYNNGRFDSTMIYAERYHQILSDDPRYHYLKAKAYYGMRNIKAALNEGQIYVQSGAVNADYADYRAELEQLLPQLKTMAPTK